MKKLIGLGLAFILAFQSPCIALAPESMYGQTARDRAAQDWEAYAASPEFAGRLTALCKAWTDKSAGEALPELLAREDAKWIKAGYGGCVAFDEDDYRVYPAGKDAYYLRARVFAGDQKGRRLYLVVTDQRGRLSGELLNDDGFRQHVANSLGQAPSKALEDAVDIYARRERYIGLKPLQTADEMMDKIELADEIFTRAKLDKRYWFAYVVRTVGLEIPSDLLPAMLSLSHILQQPVPDYLEQALPEHVTGASDARRNIVIAGQRMFEKAPREFQADVFRYVLDMHGVSAQQEDWIRKLFFLGPLGAAGDLAFYPYPAWARDGESRDLMEQVLASSGMDYAMLRSTALSGYWDAYRPLFDLMRKEIASKEETALARMQAEIKEKTESDTQPQIVENRAWGNFQRAVERAKAEAVFKLARRVTSFQEELRRMIGDINGTPGMPHAIKARVSSFIMPGSAADVHPAVLQARQTVWAVGVLAHNVMAVLSGAEMSLSVLRDAAPVKSDFSRWVLALKRSREALGKQFTFLREVCPSDRNLETLEQAAAVIRIVSEVIADCRKHALGMRMLVQAKLLPSAHAAGFYPGQNRYLDIVIRKYATMMGEFDNLFDQDGELKNKIGSDRWINLGAILTEDLVRERWGENLNNIMVRLRVADDVPDTFMDRNIILDHLVAILVNNAGQAMGGHKKDNPEPGTLTIGVRRHADGNQAEMIVEDTGGGMPDEIMPHVFTLNFTHGKGEEGHGVGLDAAMATVRRYGGSIKVDSTRGAGTRFTMVFPSRDTREKGLAAQRGCMVPAQAAALAALPYVGDGAVEAVQRFAADLAQRELMRKVGYLNIRGTWIGEGKSEQPVGKGDLPVAVLSNALEGKEGIIFGDSQGTQSIVAYAGLDDFLEVPDTVYLYSIIVGEKAAGAGVDIYKPVQENLQRIAARLRLPIGELQGAMLFKTRHYHLLRKWLKAGMKAHRAVNTDDEKDFQNFLNEIAGEIQDGKDFQSGNILFSSKTDVQLVHALYTGDLHLLMGAADRNERLLSALFTWALGGEMMARPVSKDKLNDHVANADVLSDMADDFSRDEWRALRRAGILPNGAAKKELLSEPNRLKAYKVSRPQGTAGLVHASQYLMHAAAVKSSRWIPEMQGIRVDPLTGDKTVSGLSVSSDNPLHTIEITYAGEYLDWERLIHEARERGDTEAQVLAMTKYADILGRDGDYANAVHVLENALSLAPSRALAAKLQCLKGLHTLVHGRAEDQVASARAAFAKVKEWDPDLYATVSGLDDLLGKQPPDKRVHGMGYLLSYAPGSGRITLSLLDRQRDMYYDQHITAGIVLDDGRTLWTTDYPGHDVETTPYRDHVEMAAHYYDAEGKDKPDLWVYFNFPNDRPYFTVRMKAQNRYGSTPVGIEEWTLMHSHAMTLGQEPGQTIAYPEFRPMGAWAHLVSRLGFGVAFTGWEQDSAIEHRQGVPASFRAVSKNGGLALEPGGSAGSGQLAVRVQHHPLNAAGGFALWDAIAALSKVPGAEPGRWPDFGEVLRSLGYEDERRSLISAAVMSRTGVTWEALLPHLPEFLRSHPTLLEAIREGQAVPVETSLREEPSLFYMDIPLGDGKAKLAALFNVFDHDTEWDLYFEHHLRLTGKEYALWDIWENRLLGEQAGGRISGNYKFGFQDGDESKGLGEAIGLRGVKFLLIFNPNERLAWYPAFRDANEGKQRALIESFL